MCAEPHDPIDNLSGREIDMIKLVKKFLLLMSSF